MPSRQTPAAAAFDKAAARHGAEDAVGCRRVQARFEGELLQRDRVRVFGEHVEQFHHALDDLDRILCGFLCGQRFMPVCLLYLGQIDVSKIAKEYGVDISKYNAYVSYYYLDLPELKYLIDDVVSQYSGVEGYTYQAFFYPTRIAYEKHVIEYPKTFTIEQGDATLSEHKIFQSSLSGPIGYTYSGNRVMSYGEYNDAYVFKYETWQTIIFLKQFSCTG